MSRRTLSRARRRRPLLPLLLSLVLALGLVLGLPVRASADGPTTFDNPASIAIPGIGDTPPRLGPALPYPSNVGVTGMTGTVTKVTVTFRNLTHTIANDIDAMVVAPDGRNLVVMSDATSVGTFTSATNATLTFDDEAQNALPLSGAIASGQYKPTNRSIGDPDAFPAGAPTPSNATSLGVFTGMTSANGTWSLYVVDDGDGDIGNMAGGWSLTVTTATTAVSTTTALTSSDANSTTGQTVIFTATVRTGAGAPVTSGTVQFVDETTGIPLGSPAPNSAGVATVSAAGLAEGSHLIRATYSGAGFLGSSASLTQRVDNATVVNENTFCNTGGIGLPASGSAPYPSNIFVTGLSGEITKVTANLRGVTHPEAIDLDVLLSGPTPTQNIVLLSDAGLVPNTTNSAVTNANLVFDDAADGPVPSPIVSGRYLPTDLDRDASGDVQVDTFPSAPPLSGATQLSTFDRSSANGTWSLWVIDDVVDSSDGSISGGWCLTIEAQVETETDLAAEPTTSIFNQSVTFSASVSADGDPVLDGSVRFSEGGTVLDTVPIGANGTATFETDDLTIGTHTITASYLGTDTYGESADTLDYEVSKRPTVTAVISSANPSDVGQPVTFTATVTDAGSSVTTGTVQFSIDGASVGGAVTPDANGRATYQAVGLTAGSHPVSASYSGTGTLDASTGTLDPDQDVQRLLPTGILTADPGTAQVNQAVTLTATFAVAGSPATPGTVDFTDGATVLCAAEPVDANGVATCSTAFTAARTHSIVATFARTDTYAEAIASLSYVIGLIPTETTLAGSGSPSGVGDPVIFTATVSSSGTPVPTGVVRFSDDGTVLCAAVPVDGDGRATCSPATLAAGPHPIQATYLANATYAESRSNVVNHVVDLIGSTTAVSTVPNPSDPNQDVIITATVVSTRTPAGPTPTGTVIFTIEGEATPRSVPLNGAGVATITVNSMEPGVTRIDAAYSGDTTYAESDGNTNHGVRPVADAGGPYSVAEGASLTLDGSGSTEGVSYGWDLDRDGDFDDVTGPTPTLTWDQLEALGIDDGLDPAVPVTVRLQVRLDDIPSATVDAQLTVANTAPAAVLTGGLTATVGLPFTIKVGADDPSSVDMAALFTYTVDWGDGSPVASVVGPADPPVTHTYTAAGDYDASFTATDKDGATGPPTSVTVRAAEAPIVVPSPTPTTSDPDDYSDGDTDDSDTDDSSDSLASTGSPVGPGTIVLGLVLLLGGGGVLLASRRQRLGGPRRRG